MTEGARSLEERIGGVTAREGRLQGLEALKVQVDADKAALEQRRLQLDSAETEASCFFPCLPWMETLLIWLLVVPFLFVLTWYLPSFFWVLVCFLIVRVPSLDWCLPFCLSLAFDLALGRDSVNCGSSSWL